MARIFISYRREDGRADAGRLAKDLRAHLGEHRVFRDIDTLEPGVDFVKAIGVALGDCAALLVLIGPGWLGARDAAGRRRLDDPQDFVRLEVEAALSRDIRVIPVLLGGAGMPATADLPPPLAPLARRHAHELSESRWDYDVDRLAKTLVALPGLGPRPSAAATGFGGLPGAGFIAAASTTPPLRRLGRFAAAAVLSAMGVIFLLAALIEGQALALLWAGAFLGGAWWLFTRR
jgi:hypothetical protein